jgi:hypothetical protein
MSKEREKESKSLCVREGGKVGSLDFGDVNGFDVWS